MVVQATIKAALLNMAADLSQITDYEQGKEEWADKLATVITNAILSITVNAGIPVATTGSSSAQTGATTSTGTVS